MVPERASVTFDDTRRSNGAHNLHFTTCMQIRFSNPPVLAHSQSQKAIKLKFLAFHEPSTQISSINGGIEARPRHHRDHYWGNRSSLVTPQGTLPRSRVLFHRLCVAQPRAHSIEAGRVRLLTRSPNTLAGSYATHCSQISVCHVHDWAPGSLGGMSR